VYLWRPLLTETPELANIFGHPLSQQMKYNFTNELPVNLQGTPEVISGHESHQFSGTEYLLIQEVERATKAYEIRL
jgi:hypothetical protein